MSGISMRVNFVHQVALSMLVASLDLLWDVLELGQVRQYPQRPDPRESQNDARDKNQAGIAQPGRPAALEENPSPPEEGVELAKESK